MIAAAAATAAPAAPPVWKVVAEVVYFVGLVGLTGASAAYVLVVAPALRRGTDEVGETVARRAGSWFAALGPFAIVALWLQLAAVTAAGTKGLSFGAALSPAAIAHWLATPADAGWISPGALLALQNLLYLAAAIALTTLVVGARTGTRVRTVAITAAVASIAGTVVGAVPVAATAFAKGLSTALTQVHVLGGTTWIGGLAFLAALGIATRRVPGSDDVWAVAWQRFSTLAMVAVGCVLASGLWLLWMHVGTPAQLLTTTYGRFLLVKLALVLVMLVAGALNQLSLLPRIARLRRSAPADVSLLRLTMRRFPLVVAAEAALGLGVLVIVPFLSGSARKQAGDTGSTAVDAGVLTVGVLFVAMLAVSFVATVKVGNRLGRRDPAALVEVG